MKTIIIAEMANAHEGSDKTAVKIIEAAAKAGADAVKFQVFRADEIVRDADPGFGEFRKLEFSEKQWSGLIDYAKKLGLGVYADVFGAFGITVCKGKADGYKIHSTDASNPDVLSGVAGEGKVVLLSVAGAKPDETADAIDIIGKSNKNIILIHGYQGFPTGIEDVNLSRMNALKEKFMLPVGFSDHTDPETGLGIAVPVAAAALGAAVIEKHITLDRSEKGTDYYSSLNPGEFAQMVKAVRGIESAMGSPSLGMSEAEAEYRKKMKKSIVAADDIKKGSIIKPGMFAFKRAGSGLSPMEAGLLTGKKAMKNIKKDEVIIREMVL